MTVHPSFRSVPRLRAAATLLAALALAIVWAGHPAARARREFHVSAHKYAFQVDHEDQPVIRVEQGDVVHITFSADDIPHSFTIDDPYRISKRAEPGKPVTFEFVANTVSPPEGFPVRCTLTIDDRCQEMIGRLIVVAKPPDRD